MSVAMTRGRNRQSRVRGLFHLDMLLWILVWMLCLLLGLQVQAAIPDFSQLPDDTSSVVTTAGDNEFLPVDQAFALSTQITAQQITWTWQIAPNYSLYRDRILLRTLNGQSLAVPLHFDRQPILKHDPSFGLMTVFHDRVSASVDIATLNSALAQRQPASASNVSSVILQYQGCADAGLCFPPVEVSVPLLANSSNSSIVTAAPIAQPTKQNISTPIQPTQPMTVQAMSSSASGLASFLAQAGLPLVLLTMLVLGIGLTFTPCVFPMMPILSGLIAGESKARLNAWRGFQLSVAYVLGMASTYAILGTLMGFFGARANVQLWLQQPVVLVSFALLFVVLALSMFGLFHLQLPSALRHRLHDWSSQHKGGRLGSVLIMGALSALVVSPCVSAPLAGVLIYISSTGDALIGGLALFSLGLGMGIPLILLGTGSGRWLPKAGDWMNRVKAVFGVGMLAVAIWLLSRVISGQISLLLWAMLWGGSAVMMGAFEAAAAGLPRLIKALALLFAVYALFLLIGSATGQDDPLNPLAAVKHIGAGSTTDRAARVEFTVVTNPDALQAALNNAQQQGKAVVLDVSADWCAACQQMQRTTFRDPAVIDAWHDHVRLQMDLSANTSAQRQWLEAMHLYGPPALMFFDPMGVEQVSQRMIGEADAERVLQVAH
jgi:thiol:disulfide interchange protein DsbD